MKKSSVDVMEWRLVGFREFCLGEGTTDTAEISWRYVKEGGDILDRDDIEYLGVFREKVEISFLRCLSVHVKVSSIDLNEDGIGCLVVEFREAPFYEVDYLIELHLPYDGVTSGYD